MDFETPKANPDRHALEYEHQEKGRQLIDAIVRKFGNSTTTWDYTDKPRFYRLTVSQRQMRMTIQLDGETLANHAGPEFQSICDGLLQRLRRMFGPPLDPH